MRPVKILFICLGNICRSPAAEEIMRRKAEDGGVGHLIYVDSAGIGSWHVGQLPDYRMRRHGTKHGYDFQHRARQLQSADFSRFDYIIGMDAENIRDIAAKAPNNEAKDRILDISQFLRHHPDFHDVPDPYYGSDRDFEIVIELLEDACSGLLDYLMTI